MNFVYVLLFNGNPVYVGLTTNVKRRVNEHRYSGKEFDDYKVIYQSIYLNDAVHAEIVAIGMVRVLYPNGYNKERYGDTEKLTNRLLHGLSLMIDG